ncbi:TonB-dependent siderophore receptor [Psychromonas sp. Urea-02u-13]
MKRTYLSLFVGATLAAQTFVAFAEEVIKESNESVENITVSGKSQHINTLASASKMNVETTELPFAVSIIDKEFIRDTGSKNIQDALLYTSGVHSGAFGLDARADWSLIRAVEPTNYLDGMKYNFANYNNTRTDPYTLEQIEVLKGPSSVLFGQGSTGGIINMVTKKPQQQAAHEIWVQGGSNNRKQIAVDSTGQIAESAFLYRVVALAKDAETQVDHTVDKRILINPSLTWMIQPETNLTLMANYQQDTSNSNLQFFPAEGTLEDGPNGQGKIPTNRFFSEQDWDKHDTEQFAFSGFFDHRVNSIWSIDANARYTSSNAQTNSMYSKPIGKDADGKPIMYNPDGTVNRVASAAERYSKIWAGDIRNNFIFDTGAVDHQALLGFDVQKAITRDDTWYGDGGSLDPYNPVYKGAPTGYELSEGKEVTSSQFGLYLNDQIDINQVTITAGLRYDISEIKTEGVDEKREDDAVTGRIGGMYHFDNGLSPYLSYSQSFEPQSPVTDSLSGELIDRSPLRGEQYELGLKYQSDEHNILATASVYQIAQKNRTQQSPVSGLEKLGDVEIEGFELEVIKKWDQIDLIANLTLQRTEDTETGKQLDYTPETMASVWSKYNFEGTLSGLNIGLGGRFTGETVAGDIYETPSTTLFDAMVSYDLGNWRLSADAKNLFDKTTVSYCSTYGTCGYGERLNVTANASYAF